MIDVILMSLSLLVMLSHRDQIWTPTFEGTPVERYAQAVDHYQVRMGLDRQEHTKFFTLEVSPERKRFENEPLTEGYCAWVRRPHGFDDFIGYSTHETCKRWKPELLALHEQCHRRYAHIDREVIEQSITAQQTDLEVKRCMKDYGVKVRK